jgi:MFS family permease
MDLSNQRKIKQGLKENLPQFILLILVTGFVGAMVGLERSIFPEFAATYFDVTSFTAILSFILAFGISKAITNYYTGKLMARFGRKNLLVFGWVLAIPVPVILLLAPSWNWVVFANVFLGVSQGMTWSCAVVMKIDLVGSKQRGLAMGLNEFAGYFSLGLFAYFSSVIGSKYGVFPYPFILGVILAITGLLLSFFLVKDTANLNDAEIKSKDNDSEKIKPKNGVFLTTSFRDKTLSAVTQAGLVNNLNDGMIWGLFPILLHQYGYDLYSIGVLTALYPIVWGLGQIVTGILSDKLDNKKMIVWGMGLQAISIVLLPYSYSFWQFGVLSIGIGIGTALVYPTFLRVLSNRVHPIQRPETLGTFRFWRDLGYVLGAIGSGIVSDLINVETTVIWVGIITLFSGILVARRMKLTLD